MNKVEVLFLEQLESEKFHDVTNDDFSFVDSIIDQTDLEPDEEVDA